MNSILETGVHGYCSSCEKEHTLPVGNSKKYCLKLMEQLESHKRLDYLLPDSDNRDFSTSHLFGEARGKMFGVLEGLDHKGKIIILQAFSGQYNGYWNIPDWVAPLFDVVKWQTTTFTTEKAIKQLGREMEQLPVHTARYQSLKDQRKKMSQELMVEIHKLYRPQNFRDQTSSLAPFFPGSRGVPTGTGDCCGPKLLHHAQNNNILPLGISEFYWGRENRSGSRQHGHFYPACLDKCFPIMGFMLCGLTEKRKPYALEYPLQRH